MGRATILLACVCLLVASGMPTATGQSNPGNIAKELIGLTKAQWASDMAGDVSDGSQILHNECTMFVQAFPNRLDGKDLIYKFRNAEASGSDKMVLAEMANEKVQVYGDTAVLTYNFVGMSKNKDGVVTPIRSKSTRVYVNEGGRWLLVHANFAPVEMPEL